MRPRRPYFVHGRIDLALTDSSMEEFDHESYHLPVRFGFSQHALDDDPPSPFRFGWVPHQLDMPPPTVTTTGRPSTDPLQVHQTALDSSGRPGSGGAMTDFKHSAWLEGSTGTNGVFNKELPEFVMEDRYVQGNARVTRKNSEIVKKLNGMRVLWIQYQTELTKSVPQLEIRVTMRGLSNLKNQIHRLQADIRSEGGLAYPMPALLENVPDV